MHQLPHNTTVFEREYKRAQTHSRIVAILKFSLPVLAFVIFACFIAFSFLKSAVPDGVVIQSAAIEDGKIIMQSPVVAGQNKDGLPYRMKAARAIQDIGSTSVVTLENIEAELPQKDGSTAQIIALEGIFNQDDEMLTFTKPFSVKTTSGMQAEFDAAVYDFAAGEFTSQEPVDIKFGSGDVSADSIKISESGSQMNLNGNVKMMVIPQNLRNQE